MPYRWTILAVGVVAQTSFAAVWQGIPVLTPDLRSHYGLSLPQVGVMIAAVSIGSMLTLLPWGFAADRFGERTVIALGLAAAAATLAGAAFAPGFGSLVGVLVATGALGASVNAASGRAVMGWFAPAERGLALGYRQASIPIGGFLAALVLPHLGLRAGLLALAGAMLAGALASLVWMRDGPPGSEEEVATRGASPLRDRRVWRISVGSALLVTAQTGILGFVVLFLHAERGLSTAAAAGVLAGVNAVGIPLRILLGRRSDRTGMRVRPLRRVALGIGITLGAAVALFQAPNAALIPALVLAGALAVSWNGLAFTATAEAAGQARSGAALGFQQTLLSIAGTVTPLAFAPLAAATSWQAGFGALVAFPLAGFALLGPLAAAEAQRRRTPESRSTAVSSRPCAKQSW